MGGAQLLWPEQHDGDHDQVGEQAHNNWGEGPVGLDWIGFTIGYLSCHCSKDCPMAPFSLTRPCASRSVVVLSKENPLQGYQRCETLNSNLIEKHCQRHNGPEG